MTALLLLFCALWIAAGAGRWPLDRLALLQGGPLERFVYAAALGLATAAYGVFALGLVGLLAFWPITVWWLLLAGIGARGMLANARDLREGVRNFGRTYLSDLSGSNVLVLAAMLVLLVCGVSAVICCFQPPTGLEWDALSYHLADPKVFLADRRITSLPTEHHSNFPLTMEMLFTVGLLYNGYALADLFHFLMAALTVLALLAFCARVLSPLVGYAAAVLFATTPPVLWEAHTAYIDLGSGLYATLAVLAALGGREILNHRDTETRRIHGEKLEGEEETSPPNAQPPTLNASTALAGAMMGFALGIKYLALVPFLLVLLLLVIRRVPLRSVAAYVCVALALAAPWYLKNIVLTHNPVYPYFYSLFPNSRYWSADRAAPYQAEQDSFGYPHSLHQPAEALQNLLQTPWHLLVHAERYANTGNYTFMEQLGGLYSGLGLALLLLGRIPRTVRALMGLGLAQVMAWFFIAQVGRYLISILPLLAIGAGYAAWRLAQPDAKPGPVRWPGILAGVLLGGQAALLFWGLFVLPTSMRDAGVTSTFDLGWRVTSLSVPEAASLLGQPDATNAFLRAHLDIYSAMQWINTHSQPADGVILYEETRGFYLDRPYLWGNGLHSAYIPYERFPTGRELTQWLRQHGIHYALINLNWYPQRANDAQLPNGPNHNEEEALQRWYMQTNPAQEKWRNVLADALRSGTWEPVFSANGVIVLQLGGSR